MKLNLLPLGLVLTLGLSACFLDPMPEGASIHRDPVKTEDQQVVRVSEPRLVVPAVIDPVREAQQPVSYRALTDTLLPVRRGEVRGVITGAAWFCLAATGRRTDLSLDDAGWMVVESLVSDWRIERSSTSLDRLMVNSCDYAAARQQLASLMASDPAHATPVLNESVLATKLNFSRVQVAVPTTHGSRSPRSLTAGSYFCADRLGIKASLTLDEQANPDFQELQNVWTVHLAEWRCDPVRVREELSSLSAL